MELILRDKRGKEHIVMNDVINIYNTEKFSSTDIGMSLYASKVGNNVIDMVVKIDNKDKCTICGCNIFDWLFGDSEDEYCTFCEDRVTDLLFRKGLRCYGE